MKNPFFSVVIPTYNLSSFLPLTINSILEQSFLNYEIIIIDDGSTDNTKEVVKPYVEKYPNIKYFWQENQRQGAARNNGIKKAIGDYVVVFDHDDLMLSGYLTILYQKIHELNNPNFITAKFEVQRDGKRFPHSILQNLKEGWYNVELFLEGNPLACHFCINTKNPSLKLFEEDRKYFTMEDWMFLVENTVHDKIYLIDEVATLLKDHSERSMKKGNNNIISARLHATQRLIEKNILDNKQQKKLLGYTFYFCSIHYYIDNKKTDAAKYLIKAIKKIGINSLTSILLLKILIGYNIIQRIK